MSIINGTDWRDSLGNLIAAHEGDIAQFNGVFYWYGSSYADNPGGRFDITHGPVWNGVQVYRSTDLMNWTYKGVALPRPEHGWGRAGCHGSFARHLQRQDREVRDVVPLVSAHACVLPHGGRSVITRRVRSRRWDRARWARPTGSRRT